MGQQGGNNKVYVGNLSWGTTTEDLRSLFTKSGTVVDAKVITDRDTGKSKGFGFVTFEEDGHATQAIADFDGQEVGGRKLKVSIAENKPRENSGRDGRNRHGGGYRNNPRMDRDNGGY